MGASSSHFVFYHYPSIEAAAAVTVLRQIPEWKDANYVPYVVGVTESSISSFRPRKTDDVLFLGVCPNETVLNYLSSCTTQITVLTHIAPVSPPVPSVQYIYRPDYTSMCQVYDMHLAPFLKKEEARRLVEAKEAKEKAEKESKEKAEKAEKETKEKAEKESKEAKDKAPAVAVKTEKATFAAVVSGIKPVAPPSPVLVPVAAPAPAPVAEEKTILQKIGSNRLDLLPWWVNIIDRFDRAATQDEDPVPSLYALFQRLISCGPQDARILQTMIEFLSKSRETIEDDYKTQHTAEAARVTKAVNSAKLEQWRLPEEVSKVETVWPVIYADLETPYDLHGVSHQCFSKVDSNLFIGRVKLTPGFTHFYFIRPCEGSPIDLHKLMVAMGNPTGEPVLMRPETVRIL